MFERKLVDQIIERMKEPRRFMQIVMGPRQTGKTTAMTQMVKKLGSPFRFVAADDPNFSSGAWLENEWQLARAEAIRHNGSVFIVDEIQKVPNWSAFVKKLWDEDTRQAVPLRVILTGSSSILLGKGLSESLMGRFEVLYSPHWSYAECKEAFGYSIDDFLYYGGYPGGAGLIKDENRWLKYIGSSIVEPTISMDILQMEDVRKPSLMRALFTLGASYSAQELSFTKILGQLQDAGNTITLAHYLDLLGQASLLTGLQNYSANQIRTRKSSPRFMVFDTALLTYASNADRQRLLDNPTDRGRLVESAVGAYLLARSREEGFEVYWWRDRYKEVDFVIKKNSKITAIEVKSGKIKYVGGSIEFKKLYPNALSLVVGTANLSLEDFLLDQQELFV